MSNDKAWLLISKDISRETDYAVFLNKHVATENFAKSIGYLAKSELDTIEWDKEDSERLREILKAVDEGKWDDAISGWEEWRSDMGPLDDDIEMIEAALVT